VIATTCCLGAYVPQLIMRESEDVAEKEFKWWLDMFGDDYYIEIQRHGMKEQDQVNLVLLKWAVKHNVKSDSQ
jgi:DNA polymerase-3 subunit alpha